MAAIEGTLTMPSSRTNLRVLEASRRRPRKGDLFVMLLPDSGHLFGRVISTTALIGPMKDVILIYIFKTRCERPELPGRSILQADNLLVSPMMTNRLPWTRGYFQTIGNLPLAEGEVLRTHCFWSVANRRYFDESNNVLDGAIEPVGEWGLQSYRTIDDAISKAIGIPLAPD